MSQGLSEVTGKPLEAKWDTSKILMFPQQGSDAAIGIHIAVVDGRAEVNLGRAERIVIRHEDVQRKDSSLKRCARGTFDEGPPEVQALLMCGTVIPRNVFLKLQSNMQMHARYRGEDMDASSGFRCSLPELSHNSPGSRCTQRALRNGARGF